MSLTNRQRALMHIDFATAMRYFALPAENVRIARESMERSEDAAAKAYRAIVNSLPRGNDGPI